jgi:predicted ribonuclease YlaK
MLVPDTNVLIHHTKPLDQVEWRRMISGSYVRLVIPILVVDELDRRKRDRGETRTRARQTLRTLKQSFENPAWAARLSEKPTDVESMHLWLDPQRHRRLPDSDLELIDRSVALQVEANRAVTLVTFDTGMALRALAAGLSVHHLEPGDDRSQV